MVGSQVKIEAHPVKSNENPSERKGRFKVPFVMDLIQSNLLNRFYHGQEEIVITTQILVVEVSQDA